MTHEIESINLTEGEILLFVYDDDIDRSADVTIYFDWHWDIEEYNKVPVYGNRFTVEFLEKEGDKSSIEKYVSHLVDDCWLNAVINNQEEPQKLFNNHISD